MCDYEKMNGINTLINLVADYTARAKKSIEDACETTACIVAVKTCEEEHGQPCVCNALVQCTSAIDKSEAVHMLKRINSNSVKVAEIEQLDEYDIFLEKAFSGCMFSYENRCILAYEDNMIEGDIWQDIDMGLKHGPSGGTLNANWSYMICNYGPGIIYFKNSGQDFRIAMYREAVPQMFSIQREFLNLSEDEILFVTVIYGETGKSSQASWKAVANIIMNRVEGVWWKECKNPIDVIKYTGFDAYNNHNDPFKEAEEYFKNRDFSNIIIEEMILTVIPVFRGTTEDITDGCIGYYSPKQQKKLHEQFPETYQEVPSWALSDELEEMYISGTENDDFKFYRFK